MPLYQLNHIDTYRSYLVWYIAESEKTLLNTLQPTLAEINIYDNIRNYTRRLEWLTTRLAYQTLCHIKHIPYTPIIKDENGRPYLRDGKVHVSLSHCFPFGVAAISQNEPIGIDLQIPNHKLYIVKKKYLDKSEIEDNNQDLEKLCIYWCAKEAIYKAHGQKGLSLRAIKISAFEKRKQGTMHAQVLARHHYLVYYRLDPNYVLAWCHILDGLDTHLLRFPILT